MSECIFLSDFFSHCYFGYSNSYKNIEDNQDQITCPILYVRLTIMIGQLGLV